MKLRLGNPLRGSLKPWPLAARLARFGLTALAMAFTRVSSKTFEGLVRDYARIPDPQVLPERTRRVVEWVCHIGTAVLFLGFWAALTRRGYAFGLILLSGVIWTGGAWYLRRTAWGLATAFDPPPGRFREVLRRLVEVIRHGTP